MIRPIAIVIILLFVGSAAEATARLCGDADASGLVTVSDGVNVLRAAAGLSSTCTVLPRCDTNADGEVTVSDGVNVLRAAAALPAGLNCACSPGNKCSGIDPDVTELVADVFPFLGDMPLLSGETVDPGNPCPDGGSATLGVQAGVRTPVTLTACTLPEIAIGHLRFDGMVRTMLSRGASQTLGSMDFQIVVTDVASDRIVH